MTLVVSDSSPLRALAHLQGLSWLDALFGNVVLPPAVADELINPPAALPSVEVSAWPFLSVRVPQDTQRVAQLQSVLDLGESQAIALAEELGADAVLMDELAGRGVAMQCGLTVVGTLGILLRAKQQNLCGNIRPLLDRLQQEINFFVSPTLRQLVLEQAGESESSS
jgi:predicted nucleic acid-binding protein